MIITRLTGGLGNQMFQYATGFALAQKHRSELVYYHVSSHGDTPRNLELHIFSLSGKLASEDIVKSIEAQNTWAGRLRNVISRDNNIIRESSFEFNSNILELKDNTILMGYWQTEEYFKSISLKIRKEFTFNSILSGKNEELAKSILEHSSASIHIRRGDYVTDIKTNAFHGICDVEYYKRAMKTLMEKTDISHYYVFSDDPSWVKSHLKIPVNCTYVDWNQGKSSYIDMQLMSNCKHNIIANSSFSWWGAWLNKNPDKIVIAPKKWFQDETKNVKDLIPKSWLKL